MKRSMMTKNSLVKFQNLVVNHESRPVKSNSGVYKKLGQFFFHTLLGNLFKQRYTIKAETLERARREARFTFLHEIICKVEEF